MATQALPVLSYSTGAGWQVLGHASCEEGAEQVVLRTAGDATLSLIRKHDFHILVNRRTALHRELNGGPDGYVFSVGKTVHSSR